MLNDGCAGTQKPIVDVCDALPALNHMQLYRHYRHINDTARASMTLFIAFLNISAVDVTPKLRRFKRPKWVLNIVV